MFWNKLITYFICKWKDISFCYSFLTLSWRSCLSYRNQFAEQINGLVSIYRDFRRERIKDYMTRFHELFTWNVQFIVLMIKICISWLKVTFRLHWNHSDNFSFFFDMQNFQTQQRRISLNIFEDKMKYPQEKLYFSYHSSAIFLPFPEKVAC